MSGLMSLLGTQGASFVQPSWRTALASILVPELQQLQQSNQLLGSMYSSISPEQQGVSSDQAVTPYKMEMPPSSLFAESFAGSGRAELLKDLLDE